MGLRSLRWSLAISVVSVGLWGSVDLCGLNWSSEVLKSRCGCVWCLGLRSLSRSPCSPVVSIGLCGLRRSSCSLVVSSGLRGLPQPPVAFCGLRGSP